MANSCPFNAFVSNQRFLSVSIDLYQRTNRKDKKHQETKTEEREREREGEREGVRASFVVAVDQSSHFFCTLVCIFFGLHWHQPSLFFALFGLLLFWIVNCIFSKMGIS